MRIVVGSVKPFRKQFRIDLSMRKLKFKDYFWSKLSANPMVLARQRVSFLPVIIYIPADSALPRQRVRLMANTGTLRSNTIRKDAVALPQWSGAFRGP
jgi:hypothetical protein